MSAEPGQASWSLQDGIDPQEWPERAREAMHALRQGSVVESPPFVFAASPEFPIHSVTKAWAKSDKAASGVVNVINESLRPQYGLIVTQTCDLVEEGSPKRPWLQLAPVYVFRGDKGQQNMIRSGRGFVYLCYLDGLPAVEGGIWVADLRILIPVEKGWMVDRNVVPAFADEAGYERLAGVLAARFARKAFATVVNDHLVRPVVELLREIAAEYGGSDPIDEVALALGRSRLDPTNAQLVFFLGAELGDDLRARILEWWEPVAAVLREHGIETLMPRFSSLDEMTAREFRTLDLLDASAFSPAD
ncbi:hypothetical protein LRS13_07705 [Svornostia abyssi]|uniref:Uncharacterized protein n=1 Tax=Svornostia abyssi TaxID=2898438 RepID=A0ABY5PLF2_9ACTN|nr:hypothetical protein LRS13_07705 [Parviterribacteraceae bacterium J379]